jgi:hypothetical protein
VTAVALSLLSYFLYMITALSAVVGAMIGLLNFSTSESVRHYPRPIAERNDTAITNSEPRLFMVVPKTKDGSPAKNVEVNSAAVATEKADAEKDRPHKPKVLARRRDKYEGHDYAMSVGHAEGSGYRPGLDAQR